MDSHYKDLFRFNRSQRRGIVALSILILLLILTRVVVNWSYRTEKPQITVSELKPLLIDKQDTVGETSKHNPPSHYRKKTSTVHSEKPRLVFFDPNKIDAVGLKHFGWSSYLIRSFINYRNALGGYHSKKQIREVYGMTDSIYNTIVPYIQWQDKPVLVDRGPLDLNSADTSMLKVLPGIGRVLSKRIVSFRDYLGGYAYKEQLLEVYGLSQEVFQKISSRVEIRVPPQKVNINEANVDQLVALPYLDDYKIARAIVNFRSQHGKFENAEDMLNIRIVDSVLFKKITPYIEVDDRRED